MSCRFRSEWLWAGTLAWLSATPLAMACSETKRQRAEPPPAMASSAPGPVEPIAAPRAAESGDARELIQRLDSQQPQLISAALAGLLRSAEPEQNAELRRRALELTAHGDPGVRGRALRLLASLARRSVPAWPARGTGWGPRHGVAVRTSLHQPAYVPVSLWEATLARAWAARIDPHPYVRAEACEALARLGYIQAIHGLVRLVDDQQPSRYELEGFALEDGRPGKLRHEIPDRSLVADSALHAIETLSAGQLRLEPIDPRQPAASASGNAQRVRTWYTQHARDRVPLPSPEPLLPADTRYRRTAPSGVERRGPRIEGRVQSVLDGESRWAK
jgi:hypothetical protein